jgi:DNA-binding NarL/FixJ family response regulator
MRILIVDDDENKRKQLVAFVKEITAESTIATAESYHGAIREMRRELPHIVLLDMSMDTFDVTMEDDGGRFQVFGGREVLSFISRRGLPTNAIVVTQFERFGDPPDLKTLDELDKELRAEYPGVYVGAVYYNAALSSWKAELAELLIK